ncbi:MAG: T9SS type A sorting domain-containing protein [Ignavibacteriaceae bacterium]
MKYRKFDEVLVNLNKISSNYNYSTEIRKNNLFNTALLYLNGYNNYSKAKEIFNEFSKQYPDDKLNLDAELLMIPAFPEEHQNSMVKETKTENQTIDNDNNTLYSLSDCYPNPFNPSTIINYSVKDAGLVKVKIYDILGSEIAELVNENKESGNHSVGFNASNLPSGVYIYTLQVNGFSASRKMLLLK